MKYFGEKSLSSAITTFLKILFYLSIAGTILGILFLSLTRFIKIDSENVNAIWSIGLNGLTITTDRTNPYPFILILLFSVLAFVCIALIYKLKNLFNNMKKERVFVEENFSLLRTSGFLIIILGFAISLVNFINWNFLINEIVGIGGSIDISINLAEPWKIISRKMELDQFSMSYSLISEPELIITGLSILFFSHLFKKALELKAENDLTI